MTGREREKKREEADISSGDTFFRFFLFSHPSFSFAVPSNCCFDLPFCLSRLLNLPLIPWFFISLSPFSLLLLLLLHHCLLFPFFRPTHGDEEPIDLQLSRRSEERRKPCRFTIQSRGKPIMFRISNAALVSIPLPLSNRF